MIHYVCKYTPVELFKGFGEECAVLEEMPENFEMSDQIAHANLCGFGKSVIQAVLEGKADELVMVNCCDSMRRVYDIVKSTGKCRDRAGSGCRIGYQRNDHRSGPEGNGTPSHGTGSHYRYAGI